VNGIGACSPSERQFVSRRQSRVAKALCAPRRYNVGVRKVYATFTRCTRTATHVRARVRHGGDEAGSRRGRARVVRRSAGSGLRGRNDEVVSEPVKPKPHYWGITVH